MPMATLSASVDTSATTHVVCDVTHTGVANDADFAAVEAARGRDRVVTIAVPATGMLRARSVHAVHADLSLASSPAREWWDAAAGAPPAWGARTHSAALVVQEWTVWSPLDAAALDDYQCSEEQRALVLHAELPRAERLE